MLLTAGSHEATKLTKKNAGSYKKGVRGNVAANSYVQISILFLSSLRGLGGFV